MTFRAKNIPIDDILPQYLDVELGNGHSLSPIPCSDGTYFGLLWCHPPADNFFPEGEQPQCGYPVLHCESVLMFEGERHHEIKSVLPLELSPSLVCKTCGAHGYVTKGKYDHAMFEFEKKKHHKPVMVTLKDLWDRVSHN